MYVFVACGPSGVHEAEHVCPRTRRCGLRRAGGGVRDDADVPRSRLCRWGNDPRHRQQPGGGGSRAWVREEERLTMAVYIHVLMVSNQMLSFLVCRQRMLLRCDDTWNGVRVTLGKCNYDFDC